MKRRLGLMVLLACISASSIAGAATREEFKAQRNVLVQQLSETERIFVDADYSVDPNSEYQQAANKLNQILKQLKSLAVQGLAD